MEVAGSITAKEAEMISEQILNLDPSIYYVSLVDPSGTILTRSLSKNITKQIMQISSSHEVEENYGSQAAIIMSLFNLAEGMLGKSKYVVSSFDLADLLVVPVKEKEIMIFMLVSTSTDAKEIVQRILRVIG